MNKIRFSNRIALLSLLSLTLGCSSLAYAGDEAPDWDQAGREITEAASAVGDAAEETTREVWRKSKELWRKTRRTSEATWDSARQESNQVWEKAMREASEALADTSARIQEATGPQPQPPAPTEQ